MPVLENHDKEQPQMLIGKFKNPKEVYQAQEVLTDFGYPKESTNIVELADSTSDLKVLQKRRIWSRVKAQSRKVITILMAGAMLSATMALSYFSSKAALRFSEIGEVAALWVLFTLVGTLVCCFLGALLWMMIESVLMRESVEWGEETIDGDNILVSVLVKTPIDAKDIAREWKNIGGKLVSRYKLNSLLKTN